MQVILDRDTFDRILGFWQSLGGQTFRVPVERVGDCTALGSIPKQISFTGLEFLLAIGRACTRPHLPFGPAQLFALYRYAGVLAQTGNNLRLDLGLRYTDSHKLAVLSDEFACGMSFLVAERVFGATYFLDFETAVSYNWLSTDATKRQRPDFIGQPFDRSFRLFLLEAKGTQESHSYCKKTQITKGCSQVTNVVLEDAHYSIEKRAVVGLALSYESAPTGSKVYLGDPADGRGLKYRFVGTKESPVVDSHYARIAAFVGDSELLAALTGSKVGNQDFDRGFRALDRSELDGRQYLGTAIEYRSQGSLIRIFLGLDGVVRRELLEGSLQEQARTRRAVAKKGRRSMNVVAEDGSALQFEVMNT